MSTVRVLKFGGTSVGSPEAIRQTVKIISAETERSDKVVVVVSALTGITNELIRLAQSAAHGEESYKEALKALEQKHIQVVQALLPPAQQSSTLAQLKVWFNDLEDILHGVFLIWELSKRCLDFVMSFGERFSAFIVTEALKTRSIAAEFRDARELIFADESFGSAHIDFEKTNSALQALLEHTKGVPVITGFIAATPRGETITLGRGGSDYSASVVGAALNALEIEIWTDVDGVMTADPRKVKKAFAVPHMSYEEAMELSHFGAKVIYPPTMLPALEKEIPIIIKNTFNPDSAGTVISRKTDRHELPVTGISSISEISMLRIQGSGMVGVAGVAKRVFAALAEKQINIILITQASSEHTICVAINPESVPAATQAIDQTFELEIQSGLVDPVIIENDLCIISVVGENMRKVPGISARVFTALGRNGVNVSAIAQGSSELNISVAINRSDESKALNALHDGLFLSETKSLNLFIIGAGLIGGTLLKQIREHRSGLEKERKVEIHLAGLANSKRMIVSESGLTIDNWNELLDSAGETSDAARFIDKMIGLNLSNSVFVDCTANESITHFYEKILDASIPVVTPNKKGQSGPISQYQKLREISRRRNTALLYETSVGAALPVISTLRDLIRSGDLLISLEAVLSGTLSFIFNTISAERSLCQVVQEAKELGLTEPDPRDDLNGLDMGRKLLILAREAGLTLELTDVQIEPFIPKRCFDAPSVDAFFAELKQYDAEFEKRRMASQSRSEKLCFIGSLRNGVVKLSLESIGQSHPFFSLSGRDNIIAFTTERYRDRPLVVRGPGAGAEVTAAGIFADIMRVVDYAA